VDRGDATIDGRRNMEKDEMKREVPASVVENVTKHLALDMIRTGMRASGMLNAYSDDLYVSKDKEKSIGKKIVEKQRKTKRKDQPTVSQLVGMGRHRRKWNDPLRGRPKRK
jgi:hypothetical protein